MFLQTIAAIAIGIVLGTITGLTPGLHINLVAVLIVSLAAKITSIAPEHAALAIISMAITHTFLDTIPSVFLGVPDPDKVAVVLPAHRLVFKGKGYEAVLLTVFGSFASLVASIAAIPLFVIIFKHLQDLVKGYIGAILIALTLLLIINEKKRLRATAIFALSGALGVIVLDMPLLKEPLLPMLSGLFGVSTLLIGINADSAIPLQKQTHMQVDNKTKYKSIASAITAGAAGSFLPGMGPSQIAILGAKLFRGLGDKGYVILVGGLNTVNMALSIAMLYAANKARNGAIVAVSQVMPTFSRTFFLIASATCLVAAGVSTILTILLSRKVSKHISKVNYKTLSISIIAIILLVVALMSGWLGLIVLITSTALGIACNEMETAKNHMMGCLLVPVILFFLA